ncbi:MAG: tetratricopeptide repeat protein [Tissierellia bacterium]|nr:tetratricopeptide repeat protein [Tissierellia bacterium]
MKESKKFDNYMVLANHFLDQNRYSSAIEAFEKSLEFTPSKDEKIDILFEIADLLTYLGNYEDAEKYFLEIQELDPEIPGVYYGLAIVNDFKKGSLEKSKKYYKKAIELDPEYDRAHYYLAHVYWDLGEEDKAEKEFKICINLHEDDFISFNDLGALYESQGRYMESQEVVEKALSIAPDYWRALFNMGVVLKAFGKHKEALEYYRKTIEINPKPNVYLNMSAIYIEEKDFEKALHILKEGLKLFPGTVNLHYNAACSLVHLQRKDEAWEEITKAIKKNIEVRNWAYKDPDLKDLMEEYEGGKNGHNKNTSRN